MKKKILAVTLVLTLCFGMTGCGSVVWQTMVIPISKMRIISIQNNSIYVLYDKNTKVMYLCVEGYNMMGITPIYNSDGTVKLYDGE